MDIHPRKVVVKMKKYMAIVLGFLLVIMLAACNEGEKTVENKKDENPPTAEKGTEEKEQEEAKGTNAKIEGEQSKEDTSNKDELNLLEVFNKTIEEANGDIDSFENNMKLKQITEDGEKKVTMDTDTAMKVILEPFNLQQNMEISMEMGEEKEGYTVEAFLTDDGFYMYQSNQDMWVKLPAENTEQLFQTQNGQQNPAQQLKQFEDFIEDFSIDQNDKNYILTLNTSKEIEKYLKEIAKAQMSQTTEVGADYFDKMKFNKVDYEIHIDKETYRLTNLKMIMDYNTEMDGDSVRVVQDVQSEYMNYNEVKEIKVPAEAIEQAEEIEM